MSGGLAGLTALKLGKPDFYLDTIDSTNGWLKLHGTELPDGALCWTGNQTRGRGRLGREWNAEKGQALAMSLLFKPSYETELLPLICGMAVSQALSGMTGEEFLIKWPNDIICGGLKICGILCENSLLEQDSFAVAGIGVNLNQTADDFSKLGLSNAGSVGMTAGVRLDIGDVASEIVNRLEPLWLTLREEGFSPLLERYSDLCINIGKDVCVLSPDGRVLHKGRAVGISPDGRLMVDDGSGIISVNSGEVSIRGLLGYA
ncbi:MAG: biotin--[acetyl-CoA-carboxylase] ligase [Oscillospiraceae bacterium]|nr:biotin--[acetyl-CoA-carboxylase] ligase [Oscillospiraceae bacterium]